MEGIEGRMGREMEEREERDGRERGLYLKKYFLSQKYCIKRQ